MLLVLMSDEKCFAVYFPLKSKTVCTLKTAKWPTGIVYLTIISRKIVAVLVFGHIVRVMFQVFSPSICLSYYSR